MAKKKASGKSALARGTLVRVKEGVHAPEFPDVSCAGWTGAVADIIGKKTEPKYVVEWDDATVAGMPASYKQQCEQKNLLYTMSCFAATELEFPTADTE